MDVDFDVFNISDFEPDLDELEKYLFNDDDTDEESTRKRKRSDDGSDETPSAKRTIFDVLDDEEELDEAARNLSWKFTDEEAECAVMSILKYEEMKGDQEEFCGESLPVQSPPSSVAAAPVALPELQLQQPQQPIRTTQPQPLQQAQHHAQPLQQLQPVQQPVQQQRRVQRQFRLVPDQHSAMKHQQQERQLQHEMMQHQQPTQHPAMQQQYHSMYRQPAQHPTMQQQHPHHHMHQMEHNPYAQTQHPAMLQQHHHHYQQQQHQWRQYNDHRHQPYHHVAHKQPHHYGQYSGPIQMTGVPNEDPFDDPFFKSLPVSYEVPFEAGHAAAPPTTQPETTRTDQPETTQKKRGRPRKQAVRAKQTTIEDYFPQGDELQQQHPYPTPQSSAPASPVPAPAPVQFPAQFPVLARFPVPDPEPEPTIKDSEVCMTVLCSALNKKKLPVTVGEIRRRMGAPECMDICAVGRLTRHAKHNKAALQRSLVKCDFEIDEHDFTPPLNARTISCLLEADAMTLAGDYRKVMTHQLPTECVRAIIVEAAGKSLRLHKDAVMQHLHRVKEYFVCAGRVPGHARIDPANKDECAMHRFSMETHGFGPASAIAVLDALTVVFTAPELPSISTKKAPSDVDPRLLAHPDDDEDIFDPAVIARIGYDCKIPVTNGELRRRVFGPEHAQASDVCTYLRKAKGKNTLPELRQALFDVGIEVTVDRMIKKTNTVFSLVSEREAMALARETAECLSTLPPSDKIISAARAHPESAQCLGNIAAALADAMVRVGETPAESRAENAQDKHLLRFAMYSHHFGHNYYASVMRWMQAALSQEEC